MELPSANKSTFQLRENVRLTFSRLDFHRLSYGLISSLRKGGEGGGKGRRSELVQA